MLDLGVLTFNEKQTIDAWWQRQRFWLTAIYCIMAIIFLVISGAGHVRLSGGIGLAGTFTQDLWWQRYGITLLAGASWLLSGCMLLATAPEWTGFVESLTMLPPALLLLFYSHQSNIQTPDPHDGLFQLLWIPALSLLGATLIHLSLAWRSRAIQRAPHQRTHATHRPHATAVALAYLPCIILFAYIAYSFFFAKGQLPLRLNTLPGLGYGIFGIILSAAISLVSRFYRYDDGITFITLPAYVRSQISESLILWIGGFALGFGLGIFPLLLIGHELLPLPIFALLATVYPLFLCYAVRSLRRRDRLHRILHQQALELEQSERTSHEQQRTVAELYRANSEQRRATSLLLRADTHLRSLLSQRIHDQPAQQSLRIRSLLGHWQHKLRVEAEHNPEGNVIVQPIIEALGKVRKISEELEGDLRGLQLLVEDAYQRQSLGLKLHLEKLIREDIPALYPESPLKVQADLWALDVLNPNLEQTEAGATITEAIAYAVTQALLNIYNHAGANFATVRTVSTNNLLEVYITDDGRGFDTATVPADKTSLFKAFLKVREAGGTMTIKSILRPQFEHGTTLILRIPLPQPAKTSKPPQKRDEQASATVDSTG